MTRPVISGPGGPFWRMLAALLALVLQAVPAPCAGPPQMPPVFDQATVQQLIDTIEQDHHEAILEAGYFGRRGSHPALPTIDGYVLLEQAADAAPVGTVRWLLLETLSAWAPLEAQDLPKDEALHVYRDIFAQAGTATSDLAGYYMLRAIDLYAVSACGRMGKLNLASDPRAAEDLADAWQAYQQVAGCRYAGQFRIPWAQAIQACWAQKLFKPVVEKELTGPGPHSYALLTVAATVLQETDPARAANLLEQARPLLPKSDPFEVQRLYAQLTSLLQSPGKNKPADFAAALKAQEELVQATGRGRPGLAVLAAQAGDQKMLDGIIAGLSKPTADEAEVNAVASALSALTAGKQMSQASVAVTTAANAAVRLLTAYLAGGRARSPEKELDARETLGDLLTWQGKPADARVVLQAASALAGRPECKGHSARIENLLRQAVAAGSHMSHTNGGKQ